MSAPSSADDRLVFARGFRRGVPSLVHPGRADGWWSLGDRAAWHDGERLFVEVGDEVVAVALEGVVRVIGVADGALAWAEGGAQVLVRRGAVERIEARRERRGGLDGEPLVARRAPAGPWKVDGFELPVGAVRARDLRPFPTGRGLVWSADGYLYRATAPDRIEALAEATTWSIGPRGAVLVGEDESWTRGAAPGRAIVDLPCPIAEPVRFSADGLRVFGVDPEGEGVAIDLVTGALLGRRAGVPVGDDAWLEPDGTLRADDSALRTGIREACWALRGDRLAGPGGRVWDLARGVPVGEGAPIQLGGTVATDLGFATAHWETGEGAHVDADGRVVGRFVLPLEEDDVVVEATVVDGVPVFVTAMGQAYAVQGERVEPVDAPDIERPDPPDGWPVPVEAEVEVGGVWWGWTTEGLLIAR